MNFRNTGVNLQMVPMSADEAWLQLGLNILNRGEVCNPRGTATKELLGGRAVIDMQRPIVSNPWRRLGYLFMAREAWWILSGRNDVKSIKNYANISKFSDDGVYFFGAYGPRIVDQIPYIIRALSTDQYTRQAVLTIWRESPMPSKDIPCSITCQFIIRQDRIHVFLNMRSSDVWLGVPYDWFNFSMLGAYVLLLLKEKYPQLQLGNLHYYAASSHMYSWDEPKFLECREEVRPYTTLSIDDYRDHDDLLVHLKLLSEKDAVDNTFAAEIVNWSKEDCNERT